MGKPAIQDLQCCSGAQQVQNAALLSLGSNFAKQASSTEMRTGSQCHEAPCMTFVHNQMQTQETLVRMQGTSPPNHRPSLLPLPLPFLPLHLAVTVVELS